MQRVFYPVESFAIAEIFRHIPLTECIPYPIHSMDSLSREKGDYLIANTRLKINRETIYKFSGFRGFGTISSGVDHVDFLSLRELGKEFIHAPGCNAGSVAEYVWFAYLQLLQENPDLNAKHSWGIVGFGNVGRALAQILKKHSIPYVFYDPFLEGSQSWEVVLSQPILTIHVPLTTQSKFPTYGMFGLKDTSYFHGKKIWMNTSRGAVVQPELLSYLLQNPWILGVLDVYEPEPPQDVSPFLLRKDWIYTPHIAGYSQIGRLLGAYRVAVQLSSKVGKPFPIPFINFLKKELPFKTKTFIREESNLLVESWEKKDWDYFERRRNLYPLREDAGEFMYSESFL